MKRIRRIYLWGSLALLLALVAGVYAFSERLLNDLLRPQLVALAAERLGAEVAVGRLSWHKGVLQIDDLRLRRPDNYALQVPRLRLQPRLGDLFARRLSAVHIDSPTLLLQPPSQASASGGGFPSRLPVTIGHLVLRNGRIDYALPERSLTVRQIAAEIDGGEDYRFSLQAELGAREPVAVQLAGQAQWRQGLQLQLERCEWGGRSLLDESLVLTIPAGGGVAGGGRFRLARFDRAAFEQLRKGLQLPQVLSAEWDFVLQDVNIDFLLAEQKLRLGLKLGDARLQKDKLTLPVADLDLALTLTDDTWRWRGTFLLAGDNPGELSGHWADGLLQGKLALQVAEPGRLKQQLLGGPPFAVTGAVRLATEFSVRQGSRRAQFDLQGLGERPSGKDYLLNLAPLRLRGAVQVGDDGVTGQARLAASDRELLTVSGRPDRLELKLLPANWSRWLPLLGEGLRPRGLQGISGLTGKVMLERQSAGSWAVAGRIASRRVTLADGLQLDGLSGHLHLSGVSPAAWGGNFSVDGRQVKGVGLILSYLAAKGRLRYRKGQLNVSKLNGTAQLTGPEQLAGRLAVDGSGFWQDGRWQARLSSLRLQDLEWLSDDGLAGLAGGRVAVSGQFKGVSGQPLDMDLQADLAAAEGLWGAYYTELTDLPIHLATRLSWQPASRLLLADHWSVSLARIGTASGSGSFGPKMLRLTGDLQIPELAGQGADLLVRLLGESRPELAEAVFGGGLQVDFDLAREAGWRLRGELRPQRLGLELPSVDLSLAGLSGRLPFDLAFAVAEPAVEVAPERGELRFDELRLGPARLAAEPLSLAVATNRLTVENPLVVEVAEGRITVAELLLGRAKEGLLLTGRFAIAGIDLQRLTADLGLAAMKGRLDADLGRIRYEGGLLSTAGEARIDAFGGQLRIGSIGLDISNLSYPQLTADLDFKAIDLYQLTQTFSFGAMNGIVDGYVHDLRLFGFTPAKFSALLESRLEGRRNISVKALNNLAILSQGGLSAALSRGVYRFIDFYRYRKIGIACELERDVFHLRGTAYPGSTRYLVHGGVLPPKIDIIAPPSAIAFSEMLKRLQRIERAD